MDMNFTTELKSRDVSITKEGYDIVEGNMSIDWELEIEARIWGIKGIYCAVMDIRGGFEIAKIPDDPDEDYIHEWEEFVYDSKEWEIDQEMEFDEWNQWCPSDIDINFDEKTITIS